LRPKSSPKAIDTNEKATYLYPVSQFTPIVDKTDPSTELPALQTVLRALFTPGLKPASWTFTAGYFNIHSSISELLRKSAEVVHQGTIITASPEANGFLGSKGMSGYLPAGYTMLSLRFLRALKDKGSSIQLREWRNGIVNTPGGWSYHAKGIWVSAGGEAGRSLPLLTVIGSSNYTRRSYGLDIECGAIVVSNQEQVRSAWRAELDNLLQHTNAVTAKDLEREERGVNDWKMRLLLWLFEKRL
jgi:CDP-diacylglycerol---glycerol-3-phosphate 3-phosphatidyltransferase